MTGIAIYMEGGGDRASTKAALRQGMEVFLAPLKDAARAKGWRWKLVPCGGRNETFKMFSHAHSDRDLAVVVLLVDAEDPVTNAPRDHLRGRDGWDLAGVEDGAVHLMVQAMEAWIAADVRALSDYYGQAFLKSRLPRTQNLETVPKTDLAKALEEASAGCGKGAYHKIKHAKDLLARIDRAIVGVRSPACDRLFADLALKINNT